MPFTFSNRPGLVDGRAFEAIKRAAAESAGRVPYWTPITGAPPRDQFVPITATSNLLPFQLYQQATDSSSSDDTTEWRSNFIVHSGTVSNVSPDNDDSASDPDDILQITFPSDTKQYLVWLNCSIDTDNGTVTDCTIEHGADGWDNYPKQPDGDQDTGDPPDTMFLTIAAATTGSDDPSDDNFQQLQIFQYLNSSVWLDMVGYQIQCDDLNGIVLLKRMSARAV